MIILKEKRRLSSDEQCRHFYYNFEVVADARSLAVRFSFSPVRLDERAVALELIRLGLEKCGDSVGEPEDLERHLPLKNTLTVSIDAPDRRLGTAHRHSPDQLITISANGSSPGFLPHAVAAGGWTVTVSAFHFVTPYVDFDLEVSVE